MAIPIRGIPVLEGEVARRFEREMRKAERGTIDLSESRKAWREIVRRSIEEGAF